jgi:hypothetical protein
MSKDVQLEIFVENLTDKQACKMELAIKKIAEKYGVDLKTLRRESQENPTL